MLNYIDQALDYSFDELVEGEVFEEGEPIDPPTAYADPELRPQQPRRYQEAEEIQVGESRPALEEQQEIQRQQQVMTPEMAALFQQRANRRVAMEMLEQDAIDRQREQQQRSYGY